MNEPNTLDELKEKIRKIVLGDTPDHFLSDNMLSKPDQLLALFTEHSKEVDRLARQNIADELGKMMEIQGVNGTWNYDPYMHGMYNGMEFCHALVKGVEPKYREAPKQWLADIPMPTNTKPTQLKRNKGVEAEIFRDEITYGNHIIPKDWEKIENVYIWFEAFHKGMNWRGIFGYVYKKPDGTFVAPFRGELLEVIHDTKNEYREVAQLKSNKGGNDEKRP